jgi:hypothetical protein
MPELRLNLITREWVIVQSERARRPEDFRQRREKRYNPEHLDSCPFCTGNEDKTPEGTRNPEQVRRPAYGRRPPEDERGAQAPHDGCGQARGHRRVAASQHGHGPRGAGAAGRDTGGLQGPLRRRAQGRARGTRDHPKTTAPPRAPPSSTRTPSSSGCPLRQ